MRTAHRKASALMRLDEAGVWTWFRETSLADIARRLAVPVGNDLYIQNQEELAEAVLEAALGSSRRSPRGVGPLEFSEGADVSFRG